MNKKRRRVFGQRRAIKSTDRNTAHHRAQFISTHLNILFKVLRSCNREQAGGLVLHSGDGRAREQSHAAAVTNQSLQQPCFCQVYYNCSFSLYDTSWFQTLWSVIHPENVYLFRSGASVFQCEVMIHLAVLA